VVLAVERRLNSTLIVPKSIEKISEVTKAFLPEID